MNAAIKNSPTKTVLCVGGANVDEVLRLSRPLYLEASNRVSTSMAAGGIARNVAQNLAALGVGAQLSSAVGDDASGDWLTSETIVAGVDTSLVIKRTGVTTGRYIAALAPNGDLTVGFADMAAVESLSPDDMVTIAPHIAKADHVFADANLDQHTLEKLLTVTSQTGTAVTVDLVSPYKAKRLGADLGKIDLVVGNRNEALSLLALPDDPTTSTVDLAQAIVAKGALQAVISDGGGTIGWCGNGAEHRDDGTGSGSGSLSPIPAKVVDVTGAGDALHSGIIASLVQGNCLEVAARDGIEIAAIMVASTEHALTAKLIQKDLG